MVAKWLRENPKTEFRHSATNGLRGSVRYPDGSVVAYLLDLLFCGLMYVKFKVRLVASDLLVAYEGAHSIYYCSDSCSPDSKEQVF